MKTRCKYSRMAPIAEVIPNPRNPNTHPETQIDLLAKILDFQGWRIPIVVSKLSGFVVRGHGRLLAAQKLGLKKVPVDEQAYENEAQEWADLVADNRIAELAEMDRSALKDIIEELDTGEMDLDLTGFNSSDLENMMSEFHPLEGDESGLSQPEQVDDYDNATIRQIMLILSVEEFEEAMALLEKVKDANDLTNNTEAVMHLLRCHADN